MKYYCKVYNRETYDFENFSRHKKSMRHKNNEDKMVTLPEQLPDVIQKLSEVTSNITIFLQMDYTYF